MPKGLLVGGSQPSETANRESVHEQLARIEDCVLMCLERAAGIEGRVLPGVEAPVSLGGVTATAVLSERVSRIGAISQNVLETLARVCEVV